MTFVENLLIIIGVKHKQALGQIEEIDDMLNRLIPKQKGWNRQMLGFGLSVLFTGMALKRFADNVMKQLVNSFMQVADNTNIAYGQIMGLTASFEFLKFTIFDAFANNEMVLQFIEMLTNMVDKMSEFTQTHPQLALISGTFLTMSMIVGAIAMTLGQISLLGVGLQMSFWPLVGILTLIAAISTLLISLFVTDMVKANPIFTALKVVLTTIGIILLTWLSPVVGVVALFVFIGVIIAKLSADFGSFGNLFKGVVRGIIMALGFLGQFILEGILWPFQMIAVGLLQLLELAHRLGKLKNITGEGLQNFVEYKPDIVGSAAILADSIKLDETKGNLFNKGTTTPTTATIDSNSITQLAKEMGDAVRGGIESSNTTLIPSTQG